ncbi:DUF5379 family protein [Methanococcus voltae]|uniref:F0F1-type ATP synthase assembly protein I n=2 Tax=Methanococcus voltae TaxID=2188 RepID=A0A8J7S5C6_METVO|nr:DUF5379 family protein [Methanococcus voltae]MBP2172765.1 F0F1-type ATP synthase assembly protein I [Methanococcus voltae]MBP2201825.1 F0F1-type ATP synthase assembly protein I [Methanococcus voltae]MCS3922649.1 F0F1-type ATP synthase assembly protein I [Methanococcus voltae PS]
MALDAKLAILNGVFGVVFGYLANYVYTMGLGFLSGIATIVFLLIGFIVSGHVTSNLFGNKSMSQKQWLGGGLPIYFFIAIVFWVLAYNGIF